MIYIFDKKYRYFIGYISKDDKFYDQYKILVNILQDLCYGLQHQL